MLYQTIRDLRGEPGDMHIIISRHQHTAVHPRRVAEGDSSHENRWLQRVVAVNFTTQEHIGPRLPCSDHIFPPATCESA